jgi:hypothetical protein
MNNESSKFIERLTSAQDVSPALRASYQSELNAMLEPKLTKGKVLFGVVAFLVLVVGVGGVIRNLFVYTVGPLVLMQWLLLGVAFSVAAWLIGRDLWRGKHSPKSAYSIGHILTFTGGTLTAVSLLIGLGAQDKPASMFNAFFLFVFYYACSEMAVHNRIAQAELAAREQMLRIECRLADLAEKLKA